MDLLIIVQIPSESIFFSDAYDFQRRGPFFFKVPIFCPFVPVKTVFIERRVRRIREMRVTGKSLGDKSVPLPICPTQVLCRIAQYHPHSSGGDRLETSVIHGTVERTKLD
jgi:hypothetical protein